MAFFLLCTYLAIVLIRPQELSESTAHYPVVLGTLVLTTIPYVFSKKNAGSPQIYLLAFLVIVIILSAITNGWSGSIFTLAPNFFAAAVVPFIIFSKITTSSQKHRVLLFISMCAALIMVHNGISQKDSDIGVGWSGSKLSEGTRITYLGTLCDPNDLGMFLVMNVPFAVYFMQRAGGILKLFWALALFGVLYGVYLTNSRGAFLGVLTLAGLFGVMRYGVKNTAILAGSLLPVVAILASKFRTIDAEEESAHGRIDAWYQGMQMLIHHPLFGVGMNSFTDYNPLTAHNSYILIVAELGVVGFTAWMSFILLTFIMLTRVAFYKQPFFKRIDDKAITLNLTAVEMDEKQLATVSFFSLVGFAATAFFLSRSYTFLLYIYAGLGVSSYYRAIAQIPDFPKVIFGEIFNRLVLISFAIIVFLYLVVKVLN